MLNSYYAAQAEFSDMRNCACSRPEAINPPGPPILDLLTSDPNVPLPGCDDSKSDPTAKAFPCDDSTKLGTDEMCLTIDNQVAERVVVHQILGAANNVTGGVKPICFVVDGGKKVSALVRLATQWTVYGYTSKTVYIQAAAPESQRATLIVHGEDPSPVTQCTGKKGIPSLYFWILAALLVILGIVWYMAIKGSHLKAARQKCEQSFTKESGYCASNKQLLGTYGSPPKYPLLLGVGGGFLVLLAWFFLKTKIAGKHFAGEAGEKQVSCSDCHARGAGWEYVVPDAIQGLSGPGLVLRKLRCRFNGDAGSCLCRNVQDRDRCAAIALDSSAPKGLVWQDQIANQDIEGYRCACCTATDGSTCFDVSAGDPLQTPCEPFYVPPAPGAAPSSAP